MTKYLVAISLQQKDVAEFKKAVLAYQQQRGRYSNTQLVEVVGEREWQSGQFTYVELSLSCTDVVALFGLGEFWGNKTMQRWERERRADVTPRKGAASDG